jgi:hypothetical protein
MYSKVKVVTLAWRKLFTVVTAVVVVFTVNPFMASPVAAVPINGLSAPAPVDGSYTYLRFHRNGIPLRWDSCVALTFAVILNGVPTSEMTVVKESFNRVSKVSGFRFRQVSSSDHPMIVFSFKPFTQGGPAGSANVTGKGNWLNKGEITIMKEMTHYPYAVKRALIMHEIGHVLGLGHSSVESQLIYPYVKATNWGKYDKEGFRQIGASQPCRNA